MGETNSGHKREGRNGGDRGARMTRDLKTLSRPRRTGSVGEEETIEFLEESLSGIDLPVTRHRFTFSTLPVTMGERLLPLLIWIIVLTALKIHSISTVAAFALFALILITSIPGTRWNRLVENLYDLGLLTRNGTNLVAVIEPKEILGRLVLMAHHDSKSQTLPLFFRISLHTAVFVGAGGVAVMYIVFVLTNAGGWIPYLWFPSLVLGIPLFLVMVNTSGNRSPGAVDNAGGLAILIEVARDLGKKKRGGIEVVFLFTGAEEEGLAGALRFAQGVEKEYHTHNTYFVNLDGVGSRGGLILSSRHSFPPVRTGGRLETILVKVASESKIPMRRIYFPISPGLDHIPIAYRGYRSVTLTSSDFDPATLSIHTRRDIPENVDPVVLSDCVSLIVNLVNELDEGVSGR